MIGEQSVPKGHGNHLLADGAGPMYSFHQAVCNFRTRESSSSNGLLGSHRSYSIISELEIRLPS